MTFYSLSQKNNKYQLQIIRFFLNLYISASHHQQIRDMVHRYEEYRFMQNSAAEWNFTGRMRGLNRISAI
jgi:hypothetical protein